MFDSCEWPEFFNERVGVTKETIRNAANGRTFKRIAELQGEEK